MNSIAEIGRDAADFVSLFHKIGTMGDCRMAYPVYFDLSLDEERNILVCGEHTVHNHPLIPFAEEKAKADDAFGVKYCFDNLVNNCGLGTSELKWFPNAEAFMVLLKGGTYGYNVCERTGEDLLGDDIKFIQKIGVVSGNTRPDDIRNEIAQTCRQRFPGANVELLGEASVSVNLR